MYYERIFREFYNVNLRYTVIGGVAVNLHGYPRATGDLDVIIALTDEEISKFIGIVKALNKLKEIRSARK